MVRKLHITIGFTLLFTGVLVYLIDRPVEASFFMCKISSLSLHGKIPVVFGKLGNNFPAFAHVFAFSVLTAAFTGNDRAQYKKICLFWFFVNVIFESGQKFKYSAISLAPTECIRNFFLNGTFDYYDVLGFSAGGILAYAFLISTEKRS